MNIYIYINININTNRNINIYTHINVSMVLGFRVEASCPEVKSSKSKDPTSIANWQGCRGANRACTNQPQHFNPSSLFDCPLYTQGLVRKDAIVRSGD